MEGNTKFRNASIYITLSNGEEIPIYNMTARDDITLCVPDALMNGDATRSVIENCCPVTDVWNLPIPDVNLILAGIKIATEGEDSTIQLRCHECKNINDYTMNLQSVIARITSKTWQTPIRYLNMQIHLVAPTLQVQNKWNIKEFRIMKQLYQAQFITDPASQENTVNQLLEQRDDLRREKYLACIRSISMGSISVTDPKHIEEFLQNADKDIVLLIEKKIDQALDESTLGKVNITCASCQKEFVLPLVLDFCVNFRNQLITSTDGEIVAMLKRLNKQQQDIKQDLLKTIWYMRGSISYSEAYMLSKTEREHIANLIKENFETIKKTGIPFV